jgi:hypothetical protein
LRILRGLERGLGDGRKVDVHWRELLRGSVDGERRCVKQRVQVCAAVRRASIGRRENIFVLITNWDCFTIGVGASTFQL